MKRSMEEMVGYLKKYNNVRPGTLLLMGTGIVPPDDLGLQDGDVVEIEAEKLVCLEIG